MIRLLRAVEALSRGQKSVLAMTTDGLAAPLVLLLTLTTTPPPGLTLPGGSLMSALWVVPALTACAAILSRAVGIARIPLSDFEIGALGRTGAFAGLLAVVFAGLSSAAGLGLSFGVFVVFAAFTALAAVGSRLAVQRAILVIRRRGGPRLRVVIYGAGATGRQLAAALRSHKSIEVQAFVDDNAALHGLRIAGLPVMSPVRLGEMARARGVRRVLLALPSLTRPRQMRIARRLERDGLEVMALPSFAQLVGQEPLVERLKPVKAGQLLGRRSHGESLKVACDGYRGRSVLISGAGGSIGSELCRQVIACGPSKLVLFEVSELALYNVDAELGAMAAEAGVTLVPVLGSVTDARQVGQVLAEHDVDVVLHAAAYKHVPLVEANPLAGLSNNVLGTHVLARAAVRAGVERFVLVSSDKAVRPTGVMGASKRLAELVVRDLAARVAEHAGPTRFATVRFGNVLGSSGSVVPLFQEQVARGGPVTLTHDEITRYFMTIEEAVRLVLLSGSMASGGETFVLHMGEPVRIGDLARSVIEAQGYTVRDGANPEGDIEVVTTGLRPGEKLHEELTVTGEQRATSHPKIFATSEDAASEVEVAIMLRDLQDAVEAGDPSAALAVTGRLVEGRLDAAPEPVTPAWMTHAHMAPLGRLSA